jgi:hypothetical protein
MALYEGPLRWNGVIPVSQYRCLWRHAAEYRSAEWIEAPRHRIESSPSGVGYIVAGRQRPAEFPPGAEEQLWT